MLGVVPRELWKKDHPPDDQNRIRLNLTCPLVIDGNHAILIDCGIGNRLSDSERRIFEGFLPECLTAVGLEESCRPIAILRMVRWRRNGDER